MWPAWPALRPATGRLRFPQVPHPLAYESFDPKRVIAHYPIDLSFNYSKSGVGFFAKVHNLVGTRYNQWRWDQSDGYLGREVRVGMSLDL